MSIKFVTVTNKIIANSVGIYTFTLCRVLKDNYEKFPGIWRKPELHPNPIAINLKKRSSRFISF